jgi:hypothetical protein
MHCQQDIYNKCTADPTFCTTQVKNPFFWQNLNPAGLPAGFLDSYKNTSLGAAASVQGLCSYGSVPAILHEPVFEHRTDW